METRQMIMYCPHCRGIIKDCPNGEKHYYCPKCGCWEIEHAGLPALFG